jgi:hypothetical protein
MNELSQQGADPNPDSWVCVTGFVPSALFVVSTSNFLPLDWRAQRSAKVIELP